MRRPALLASFVLAFACGGSSSETPPPLEPDPARLRAAGPEEAGGEETPKEVPAAAPSANPKRAVTPGLGAGGSTAATVIPPLPPRRGQAPASTWGGAAAPPRKPAPELAPEPQL